MSGLGIGTNAMKCTATGKKSKFGSDQNLPSSWPRSGMSSRTLSKSLEYVEQHRPVTCQYLLC